MKIDKFIQNHLQERSLLSDLLYPASLLYDHLGQWRQKQQAKTALTAPFKVISVGNISSGGSGKTPLCIALAKASLESGLRTAVSHRGYKAALEDTASIISMGDGPIYGVQDCSDEAWMSATILKGAYVSVGRDRIAQVKLLSNLKQAPEILIMDDSFQNRRIKKNLSILCFDASIGLGNGRVIPAGYLRESISAISRAEICVINRKIPDIDPDELIGQIQPWCDDILVVDHHFDAFLDFEGNEVQVDLAQPSLLVSALASPSSFEAMAQSLSINYQKHYSFADHYSFASREALQPLIHQIQKEGIKQLFCSYKDLPKLLAHKDLNPLLRVITLRADPLAIELLWQKIRKKAGI